MEFTDKVAVITGGGSGIGRALALRLYNAGCHIALGDVAADGMAETKALCHSSGASSARVTTHLVDVSDETQVQRFRDEVAQQHATTGINLLFNNAGIGGGGSMFSHPREQWEKTFNICWGGVYTCTRVFMPMLTKAREARLVNVSSINGLWASIGPDFPHTAYSAAKFAVRGFTEALITDLRIHAPHVKCSVVMPGHIGTALVSNSRLVQTDSRSEELTPEEIAAAREQMAKVGIDESKLSDQDIRNAQRERATHFQNDAPTTAAQAAEIILDGILADQWRILVGDDAKEIDRRIRQNPEGAYGADFFNTFAADVNWQLTPHPQTSPEG